MSVPSEDERLWMVYAEVPMGQFDGDYLRWRAREVALISTPICWSCFKADSCRTDRWACSATQRLMPTCGRAVTRDGDKP